MQTEEQLEITGIIRIIEVSGQNAFALYQQGQISLSKLVAEIAEEITTAPELRITILRLAYNILADTGCTKNSPIRYMCQDVEDLLDT